MKRKQFSDITNCIPRKSDERNEDVPLKSDNANAMDLMPIFTNEYAVEIPSKADLNPREQNVHPLLGWYKHDLETGVLSYDALQNLLRPENDIQLLNLLTDVGMIAKSRQCQFCGSYMRRKKDGEHWFWICTRTTGGKKCNRGKKSIRNGTIFDNQMLTIQQILFIFWHFVHHLSIKQCAQYTNISDRNNTSVCKWYKFCRELCTEWFFDAKNTPKLGGFGRIVEMDESYFPGKPKYNRGRRLGESESTTWGPDDKWVFGLTERGTLDAIAVQVPPNRTRAMLLPIINRHCNEGTIFCSDGWKAYHKLADHLDLEDVLHYSVNHSKNYVDQETGAHTQTIEGFWRYAKSYLPAFGMKPKDLNTYLGAFCWYRFCKQRKLDQFVHLLRCISELRPIKTFQLPVAQMLENSEQPDLEHKTAEAPASGTRKETAVDVDNGQI